MSTTNANGDALRAFRAGLRGSALAPGEPGYESARRIWNGTIDKRPALIARCSGVADVVAALRYASSQGLSVSVHGGGHHVAGSSLIDGGLVVDLSPMRSVQVMPWAGRVRCEGGALIGDLDRETQVFNLAVPLGLVSATGVAGLTLAGGVGWMRRKYGLSCDNLLSADVVLADGRLVHATPDENAELLWALRGGGWDLGVVVAFEFKTYPLGPDVFMTFVTYPLAEGRDVLRRFEQAYLAAPEGMAPLAVCWTFPEADTFPRALWGKPFVGVIGPYIGPPDEGERAAEPFRKLGTVLTDLSGVEPWVVAQRFFDADYPDGRRYYWKSTYLKALPDAAIDTLLAIAEARPSQLSSIDIWPMGGAVARVGVDQSPLGHRDAPFMIGVECNWEDPAADRDNIAFGRASIQRLEPFSSGGSYMNFEDPDDPKATADAYGAALQRLRRVKERLDPENLFRSRRGLIEPRREPGLAPSHERR